jgi:hypothetical protein
LYQWLFPEYKLFIHDLNNVKKQNKNQTYIIPLCFSWLKERQEYSSEVKYFRFDAGSGFNDWNDCNKEEIWVFEIQKDL